MLTFAVYNNGKPADRLNLAGAYVVGSDDVPIRAELSFKGGILSCKKRSAGPAGLVLLWPLPGLGTMLHETVRLLERSKPYNIVLELARGRLMRINQKLEDWGMLHHEGSSAILQKMGEARESLISALQADTASQAAELGERALIQAVQASESLTQTHAEALLHRRKQSGAVPKRVLGCTLPVNSPIEAVQKRLSGTFDFVTVPFIWRDIEPKEQTFHWKPIDAWVETLAKMRMPMHGSTLLSFHERNVPDWLYTWENDFDTLRDLAFEHARRVINRYGQYIQTWEVISGIHAPHCFAFNFEQLMELTRMTAALAKQASPRSTVIVDLVAPWGEYYARNQRTIPPLLYADMVAQSGVHFDAIGLRFFFGPGVDGMFVRDMFQISSQIDQFAKMGKPVHITAVQVPSDMTSPSSSSDSEGVRLDGGTWHDAWSEDIQAQWLSRFLEIAMSKPFVDSVSWHDLSDHPRLIVPHGGLLRSDHAPKAAYQRLAKFRSEVLGGARRNEPSATG